MSHCEEATTETTHVPIMTTRVTGSPFLSDTSTSTHNHHCHLVSEESRKRNNVEINCINLIRTIKPNEANKSGSTLALLFRCKYAILSMWVGGSVDSIVHLMNDSG